LTYRIREVPVTFSLACPQIQFLVGDDIVERCEQGFRGFRIELADLLVIVGVLPKREEAVVETFELRGQVGPALFIGHVELADLHTANIMLQALCIKVGEHVKRIELKPVIPIVSP
jgi:hypothetical protein